MNDMSRLASRGTLAAAPAGFAPLAEILSDLDPSAVAEIVYALRNDIEAALSDVRDAWRLGDARMARRAAHRLVGLFGHCGAKPAATIADQLSATADDLDALALAPALIAAASDDLDELICASIA